ncbi:MAG: ribosomal protein S18-alanine N-acetyltransferase [Acidimicrobiia bacterium]
MIVGPEPIAPPAIAITAMRRRHVRSVMTIETSVYPKPWTSSLFLSELALPASRCYLVARAHRTIVGYAGIMFAPDEAHVTTIAVDQRWQRRHVATQLLLRLTREAIDRNYTALTLEVRVSARGAQGLYRRFGFTPEGARKDYYAEPTEDAIVMWVRGIDTPTYAELLAGLERRARSETAP